MEIHTGAEEELIVLKLIIRQQAMVLEDIHVQTAVRQAQVQEKLDV